MKHMPFFLNFIAVMALSASLAYWALQLFPLPQRTLAATPLQAAPAARLEDATTLFGGQAVANGVSHYELKGVLAARNGRGSVAILGVDGKPAQATPVGAEVAPGITVREVRPSYVLLAKDGALKRVELASTAVKSDAPIPVAPAPAFVMPAPVAPPLPAPLQPAPKMSGAGGASSAPAMTAPP